MKKRMLALLLLGVLCLGLMAGCGGNDAGGKDLPGSEGTTVGAGTAGKDSKDNTLLYITKDNQWMLSRAEGDAVSAVLASNVFQDAMRAMEGSFEPQIIPGLNADGFVWFSADGKQIYFLKDISYQDATLCRLNVSELAKDLSNAADCVSVIDEQVLLSVNNQVLDKGFLYRAGSGDLCYYNGEGTVSLDRDVVAAGYSYASNAYIYDDLPATGDAAFVLADGGKSVVYSVSTGDAVELRTRTVNGNGEATTLGSGVRQYFCSAASDTVFFIADGVYAATLAGDVTALTDANGRLLSSFGSKAYYLGYADGKYALYFYDGKESHLICGNVDEDCVYGDAEHESALYINQDDGAWYYAAGSAKPNTFTFENGKQMWQYCGALNGGKELVLCAIRNNKEVVILSVSGDKVSEVKTLASQCWRVRIRGGNELFFIANYADSVGDFMYYRSGTLSTLGTALSYFRTNTYSDNTVAALRGPDALPGELVLIDDGVEKHVAGDASYFLRMGSGELLYLSEGVLYLYNGEDSVRLHENVTALFCASGEYNSGATFIEYPEFGYDAGSEVGAAPAG